MDSEAQAALDEYQIQLEQVELALKSDPENDELIKLKQDLLEVIDLTKELVSEDQPAKQKSDYKSADEQQWRKGVKCMAIWRIDGRYYPATIDQILEDGVCTVIFDGYSNTEITQVAQLMPHNKNANAINNTDTINNKSAAVGKRSTFTKKELELKIREAKKRKKEKYALKIKAQEEISEKEKNKWKNFNTKLQSKTWKGVVKKNKFDLPDNHENKIGVGTNSATNRVIAANGAVLPSNSSAAASSSILNAASAKVRHVAPSSSFKTSLPTRK